MKAVLLDSNIIIYSATSFKEEINTYLIDKALYASVISCIEVLGYHKLTTIDKQYFEDFFKVINVIPLTDDIVKKSIVVRQHQKISLGDAIIAATAIELNKELVTRNTKDSEGIPDLNVYNPV